MKGSNSVVMEREQTASILAHGQECPWNTHGQEWSWYGNGMFGTMALQSRVCSMDLQIRDVQPQLTG
jgi:hypothetical protein